MLTLLILLLSGIAHAEPREQMLLVMGQQTIYDLRVIPCANTNSCISVGNRSLIQTSQR